MSRERESLTTHLKTSREEATAASDSRQSLMKRAIGAESLMGQLKEEHATSRKALEEATTAYEAELKGLAASKQAYEQRNQGEWSARKPNL